MMSVFGTDKKPVQLRFNKKEDWLNVRTGIGSSDVATILGLNPYQTPYQLWLQKTKQVPPPQENMAMMFGNAFEASVASLFEKFSQRQIIQRSADLIIFQHPEKEWARVSPDRTYWVGTGRNVNDTSHKGILECKTTSTKIDPDHLPDNWFCQLQYQMGVMQFTQGSLAWATFSPRDFGYKDFEFVPEFFAYMMEKAERFYVDCIIGGQEPELVSVDDVVAKYPAHVANKAVSADQHTVDMIDKLRDIRQRVEALQAEGDLIEDDIKLLLKDAEAVEWEGRNLVTWKASETSFVFDTKRLAREHPEIYNAYLNERPGVRRFLLK